MSQSSKKKLKGGKQNWVSFKVMVKYFKFCKIRKELV